MTLYETAEEGFRLGLTILPVRPDGSKAPAVAWAQFQTERPKWKVIDYLLQHIDHDGIGVVCGATSRNLEMIEFEGRAMKAGWNIRLEAIFIKYGELDLWKTINGGYVEITPSGGLHLYYRVEGKCYGNTKLAKDAQGQVMIETRGQGGFSVLAPSGGRTHSTGADWMIDHGALRSIPVITEMQRDLVYDFARLLDETPEPETIEWAPGSSDNSDRPGDEFNRRANWDEILPPHDWTRVRRLDHLYTHWAKPGKTNGISATTGRNGDDRLYVFSTSTIFEPERPYSKFAAYSILNFAGDFSAAARDLVARGYGRKDDHLLPPLTINNVDHEEVKQVKVTGKFDQFWIERPVLERVMWWSHVKMVSPWALLGSIMLRCLATVPPWVMLPGIMGGPGSLNAFLAIVGDSGSGKGAAEAVAKEALITDLDPLYSIPVGSGEGVAHQYAHRDRKTGEIVQDRTAVIFTCAEVDMLTALDARKGSILTSVLRDAFNGSTMGNAYVDQGKRLILAEHSYRLLLSLGVQPRRAGPLLAEESGGTPQRFWWVEALVEWTIDPRKIETPPKIVLSKHVWRPGQITIPEEVIDSVIDTRMRQGRGQTGALDGQRMLAQEKAAYALTILDDRQVMTIEDWKLAGIFMDHSDQVRQGVIDTVIGMENEVVDRRIRTQVRTQEALDVNRTEKLAQAMRARILDRVPATGERVRRRDLQRGVAGRDRARFADALDDLVRNEVIEIEQEGRNVWVRRASVDLSGRSIVSEQDREKGSD